MSTADRGFTLLEVAICGAVFALAAAAVVGGVAAALHAAAPPSARDAALAVAENAVARARAAVAYASSPSVDGPVLVADRRWALVPGTVAFTGGGEIRAPAACGGGTLQLRLSASATYDPATERFTVVVQYPRDPCAIATAETASVTLATTLPPSVYPPGQTVLRDVPPPARM